MTPEIQREPNITMREQREKYFAELRVKREQRILGHIAMQKYSLRDLKHLDILIQDFDKAYGYDQRTKETTKQS